MATTENSVLYYEAGQTLVPMTALIDSGDHKTFDSEAEVWSDEAGFSPVVRPDGVLTGLVVTASDSDDKVDLSSGTANIGGTEMTISQQSDLVCMRGLTTDVCRINSISISGLGVVSVVSGTDGVSIVETRGAAGGPPFIPVGSIEIAQVRFTSITPAVIVASEILSVPNKHREIVNYPAVLAIDFIRDTDGAIGRAGVTFSSAMVCNHTGGIPKGVYVQYYEPEFAEIVRASDFQPAANSLTLSSQPYYGGAIGEVSTSLKSGKFRAFLDTGISDAILSKEGKKIWFKYYVDRYQTDKYILTQGYLGIAVQYPARGSIVADFTVNAVEAGKRIIG